MSDSILYSTEKGALCPRCQNATKQCTCRASSESKIQGNGTVRVGRETKGRGGKPVTVVTGLPLTGSELLILAKELKVRCGTGGTVKDGVIEIQGDQRDLLVAELLKRGFSAKKSG